LSKRKYKPFRLSKAEIKRRLKGKMVYYESYECLGCGHKAEREVVFDGPSKFCEMCGHPLEQPTIVEVLGKII